ncbi:MAG TPA: FAD-dependent thymidylate synthase [Flavobacterium sp.]|nr:FAD-dependent thymidylate synthase [Flavobacterium sp.]
MVVKLVAITKGVGDLDGMMAEEIISYIARVSNPANQMNTETAPKLLKYLSKNKHWSPFEHISFTLEIETSRAIAAQILRHRSFVFQEFSQRYATATEFVKYEARRQDLKNRQNSINDMSEEDRQWFADAQDEVIAGSNAFYQEALKRGIAKEQARFLLPLSTKTRIYMTGNVRSWLHYIELRSANGTQKEHMDIAQAAKEVFLKEFPSTAAAMEWKST